MIEEIKQNLNVQQEMLRELMMFSHHLEETRDEEREEKGMIEEAIVSLKSRMKLVNASLPDLVKSISLAQPLLDAQEVKGLEQLEVKSTNQRIVLRSQDKARFLRELDISEHLLKRLKKKSRVKEIIGENYQKPNDYAKLANKFFLAKSQDFLIRGKFTSLKENLRKGNVNILVATYISMMFFSTILAAFAGLILLITFMLVDFTLTLPFIELYSGSYLMRFVKIFWLVLAPPLITFGLFYIYPSSERKSLARRIDSELPFVVIHMGSISGSGVEPSHIFKIVGLSREYPSTRGEIRKLLNQINVYGYDLVTALQNVARYTPSSKFAELLNGLSTTISSGGDLKTYFEKRADTLLLNYRLEREKFTKVAETFMDIYISVVIATPMILLLLLVMISVSGVSVGLSLGQMTLLILFVVAVINILFLWVLSMRQPSY